MAKVGITETQDVLRAVCKIAAIVTKQLKDGFQTSDLMSIGAQIMTSPEGQAALKKAQEGIEKLPEEIADVDALEGLDLGIEGILIAKAVLTVLKEPAAPAAGAP